MDCDGGGGLVDLFAVSFRCNFSVSCFHGLMLPVCQHRNWFSTKSLSFEMLLAALGQCLIVSAIGLHFVAPNCLHGL